MGSRRRSAPQVSDLIDTEGVTRARLFTSAGRSKKFAASSSSLHNGASNPRTSSHGRSGEEPIKPKRAAPISKGECNCNASSFWALAALAPQWPLLKPGVVLLAAGNLLFRTARIDYRSARLG